MQRKKSAAGYVYDFENGYELSFSERIGEFMLYRHNKPVQLGSMSTEAILTTAQEAKVINFLDSHKNPNLDELLEILWPIEEEVVEEKPGAFIEEVRQEYTTMDQLCYAAGAAGAAFTVATLVGGFFSTRKRWG